MPGKATSSPPEAPPDLAALGPIPRDGDGAPVFAAPWQAQAFAMAVALHEQRLFTWAEWAQALGAEIARAGTDARRTSGSGYYECWLAALERLVADKGLASPARLDALGAAFRRAAQATPHGAPILLDNDPLHGR